MGHDDPRLPRLLLRPDMRRPRRRRRQLEPKLYLGLAQAEAPTRALRPAHATIPRHRLPQPRPDDAELLGAGRRDVWRESLRDAVGTGG